MATLNQWMINTEAMKDDIMAEETVRTIDAGAVQEALEHPGAEADDGVSYLPAIRRGASMAVDTGTGVVDITGVMPPFLQIVQKSSPLVNEGFQIGSLVLNKQHLIAGPKEPVEIIVLKYEQYVKEGLSQDAWALGQRPRLFKSMEEAKAAGLRASWGPNGEKPEADYALDMIFMIKKPEKAVSGVFGLEIAGGQWTLARGSFDKTGYVYGVRDTFLQAVAFSMGGKPVYVGRWEFSTKLYTSKRNQSYTSWIPAFALKKYQTVEEVDQIKALFGSFLTAPLAVEEPAPETV